MRTLTEVIGNDHPFKLTSKSVSVNILLRKGRKIPIIPPKDSLDMVCQDCGSIVGYTCRDVKDRCWFCGNDECLKTDADITKKMARKARKEYF